MNKGLIRLTLVVGLAAALGACGGETTTTPPGGTDTTTTPPPVSSPVPVESPKATPGAGATVVPAPKKSP